MAARLGWILAATLLALGAWFALGRPGGSGSSTEAGHTADDDRAPPPLRAEGAPSLPGRAEPGAGASDAGAPAADPGPAPPPRHRVEGRLTGLPVEALRAARVSAWVLRDFRWRDDAYDELEGTVDAEGRYAVDLGAWAQVAARPARLLVHVEHPLATVADVEAAVPATGDLVVRLDVALERAFRVEGRVRRRDGTPVEGASVALVALEDGKPRRDDLGPVVGELAVSDAEGRFVLRADAAGPWVVLAAAEALVPQTARVDLTDAGVVERVDLVLEPGAEVSGRLRVGGEPAAAVLRLTRPAGDTFGLGGARLGWGEGGFVCVGRSAHADDDGTFRIEGIPPGPWTLQVDDVVGVELAGTGRVGREVEVEAPARGVLVDLAGAAVEVVVTADALPLAEVQVILRGTAEDHYLGAASTGAAGRARFLVDPEVDLEAVVETAGRVPARVAFRSPGTGGRLEVPVALEPEAPPAVLVVTLRDEDGALVARAGFRVLPPDAEPTLAVWDAGGHDRMEATGVYRLEVREAGRRTLWVSPGRGLDDLSPHAFGLPLREEVDLVPGEEVAVDLVARAGGRLRVHAVDADGKPVAGNARVLGPRGDVVPVLFVTGDADSMTISTGSLEPGGNLVEPPLEPGRYVVEAGTGRGTGWQGRAEAEVRAGEVTDVEVRLAPR